MAPARLLQSKAAWGLAAALTLLLSIGYYYWPWSNTLAQARIRSALLTPTTPQQLLKELAPYVKPGDRFSDVYRRIAPVPESHTRIERPTLWSLGLRDVNLVLAVEADERVVGVGYCYHDAEAVWAAAPPWPNYWSPSPGLTGRCRKTAGPTASLARSF